ncbi:MAG: glycoside hydrolase family 3 N-terminal domain-containing protein [Prevotellaceae bacterium]|nr:glycoside hydrolase family 3 N-terminal domain-containing protein [Prevotellaceae bacterium]
MNKKIATMLLTATALAGCNNPATVENYDQQVDELYNKMSQEERLAQLQSRFMDDLFDESGKLDTAQCRKLIPNGMGHFSQYASQKPMPANQLRDRVAQLQDWLINNTPNGIPALFHEEVLTGINTQDATIYPQQIGQACSFNTELAELKTKQTGIEMRKMGGLQSLSPMVDVCRTPSFNRLEESYGEDAYLSAAFGTAFVRGLQDGGLKKGVSTCSKHYLGYGGGGDADEKEMMEEILMPHEAMIRLTENRMVMPGYHAVHGTNCVANAEILTDILRGYVGFDGVIVSDYTAIDQIPDLEDNMQRAAAAINAGNDVDFPNGSNYALLPEAMKKGLVKPETFERAVKNVLKHKFRLGMFDKDAYLYSKDDITLDSPEDRQTAFDIASQSIVLLENNGILPLQTKTPNILLTGPNANSMWAMCGDYSYPSMAYFWKKTDVGSENPHIATLNEGMTKRMPQGFNLKYSRGCDWTEEIETKYDVVGAGDERAWEYEILHRKVESGEKANAAEALSMAKESDVIIAAMGENVMLCGENRDRKGIRLPGKQEQYIESLIATGKPVVLVLFGGRAMPLSEKIIKGCAAIIEAWYPGEEGGNALADILYGKISPSAKLSVSYPNVELNEPICYNYSDTKDSRIQWPFGHGLSYSTFEYSDLKIANEAKTSDEAVTLTFNVKNTGNVAADEIAQLYLSPTSKDQNIRPIQLQGFARVHLEKGETKTVSIKMYTEQFGFYTNTDGNRQWNIAPGKFTIKIGASSQDIKLRQEITLTGDKTSKPLREFYLSETTVK